MIALSKWTAWAVTLSLCALARAAGAETPGPVAAPDSLQLYEHEAVGFTNGVAYRDGSRLTGEAFYLAVDRPDLAARYERHKTIRAIAIDAGGIAAVVGLSVGVAEVFASTARAPACLLSDGMGPSCQGPSGWPWALALAGGMVLGVGYAIPADPIEQPEREAVARAHNDRVAARLGLHSLNLRAALSADGGGALMLAAGSF
jgi:hypothetical protein